MVPHALRRAGVALASAAVMLLAGTAPAAAQTTGSVRGKVTDGVTGRPVAGAQVYIQGTRHGALASSGGEYYILNVPAGSYTVRVEMIGYGPKEAEVTVAAARASAADFVLSQTAITMDEIVVTGTPGQVQKRTLGNSVASIKTSGITETAPIASVQELLTARTPGLTVQSNAGQAGASSRIRIRGSGSLAAQLEPVIYVDGVRIASSTRDGYSTSNGVVQGTSALDGINPDDIESIEVIKGPAAATLYGAEAAAGVIQIITKKGRAGAQAIRWNAKFETGKTDWHLGNPTNFWLCSPKNIADTKVYPGCSGMDPNAPGEQRLLRDDPLRRDPNALRTGDIRDFNLSASGGGENYNFFFAGEKGREEGVFFNNFSDRLGGRANFGFVPSDHLNFNVNAAYVRTHTRQPWTNNSSNGVLRNAFRGRAGATDDQWAKGFRGLGPEQSNLYDNQTFAERTTVGITANYNPFSWLRNRLTLGMDKQDRLNRVFYRQNKYDKTLFGDPEDTGAMYRFLPVDHIWTADYAGTADFEISDRFSSSLSAGVQLTRKEYETHEAIGEGFVADKLNLVSAAATTRASQSFLEQTSLGFFVQEQVGWRDRVYATAAVRVDDNSAFGRDFSLVAYPKAQLAYVVSEEEFFNLPGVDELKLRGAWGQAGNAPEPFSADRAYEAAVTTIGDATVNNLETSSYGNPDLKAETGQEIELGFESSLFGGRMGVDFTFYDQRTKDALIRVPDPRSTGFVASHFENVGEILNRGIEVMITGTPVYTRAVVWDASIALNKKRNELVSFGGALDELTFGGFASVQRHREGYPLGGFWAVDVKRDENGNPVLDSRGRAIVDTECAWTPKEEGWDPSQCHEIYMGPMEPTREVAFTNTVTLFGNLRLFANLDYKGGNYQWCAICSIRNRIDMNTWEVNNPDATPEQVAVWTSQQTLTHIQKADFLKLRELSATYTLPVAVTQRMGAEKASVTLSGRNLWMWTKYEGTADPEVSFYSRSNYTMLDYASVPMTRRLLASMTVSF